MTRLRCIVGRVTFRYRTRRISRPKGSLHRPARLSCLGIACLPKLLRTQFEVGRNQAALQCGTACRRQSTWRFREGIAKAVLPARSGRCDCSAVNRSAMPSPVLVDRKMSASEGAQLGKGRSTLVATRITGTFSGRTSSIRKYPGFSDNRRTRSASAITCRALRIPSRSTSSSVSRSPAVSKSLTENPAKERSTDSTSRVVPRPPSR